MGTRKQLLRSLQYTIDQLVLLLFTQSLNKSRLSISRFLTFSALVAKPETLLYTVATPSSCGLLDMEMRTKQKVWQRTPLCLFEEDEKIVSRTYRRYAGLGRSRVRTRFQTTRRLGQQMLLRTFSSTDTCCIQRPCEITKHKFNYTRGIV